MPIHPKKSLGQHFLNSKHVLDQIIAAANIQEGENTLEIGPGTGVLTRALLDKGAHLIAIEKDERAFEMLRAQFTPFLAINQLQLVRADILEINPEQYGFKNGEYAIVANIPYYITGAILEKFLENEPRPNRMILLVQKEVADRIVARPSSPAESGKESVLSISVKAFGTPRIVARVPRGAFTPPPTVDSAILAIDNISDERFMAANGGKPIQIRYFFNIVRAGFAHKRKFLMRNLETAMKPADIKETWAKLGLNEKIRAEDLELEQWFEIAKPR